jgi:hypothetical protein
MAEDLNPALSVGWCAFSVVTDVTEMVRKEGGDAREVWHWITRVLISTQQQALDPISS